MLHLTGTLILVHFAVGLTVASTRVLLCVKAGGIYPFS